MQTSLRRFYPEMVNHGNSKCKNLTIMRRAHALRTMTFRCESYLNRNPAINPQKIRTRISLQQYHTLKSSPLFLHPQIFPINALNRLGREPTKTLLLAPPFSDNHFRYHRHSSVAAPPASQFDFLRHPCPMGTRRIGLRRSIYVGTSHFVF